jgi:hypothetical protein
MAACAFAVPILPGRTEEVIQIVHQMQGPRQHEHAASRRRLGIIEERVWIQHTVDSDLAIFYLEAEHPERVFQALATSQDPFDLWFRNQLAVQGYDLQQPAEEPILTWPAASSAPPTRPVSPGTQWHSRVQAGMTVAGVDGPHIGHITQVHPDGASFVLERPGGDEYLIQVPSAAIHEVRGNEVMLTVPAGEVKHQGWPETGPPGAGP